MDLFLVPSRTFRFASIFLSILTVKAGAMHCRSMISISWLFFFFSVAFGIPMAAGFPRMPSLAQLSYFPICSSIFFFLIFI